MAVDRAALFGFPAISRFQWGDPSPRRELGAWTLSMTIAGKVGVGYPSISRHTPRNEDGDQFANMQQSPVVSPHRCGRGRSSRRRLEDNGKALCRPPQGTHYLTKRVDILRPASFIKHPASRSPQVVFWGRLSIPQPSLGYLLMLYPAKPPPEAICLVPGIHCDSLCCEP